MIPDVWYKFDEASGATTAIDSSGNARHGTAMNGLIMGSGGAKRGNCISYDGVNDYLQCPYTTFAPAAFTIMGWFLNFVLQPTKQIVSKSGGLGTDETFELRMDATTGNKLEAISLIGGVMKSITGGTAFGLNTWYHAAFTYDGANLNLYLNGVSDAAAVPAAGAPFVNARNITIGIRREEVLQFPWNGRIDDIRIYSSALSARQISGIIKRKQIIGGELYR